MPGRPVHELLRRAITAFVVAEGIALLFPAAILLSARPLSDAVRWLAHQTTFGVHHHTAMSIAVALFWATIPDDIFTNPPPHLDRRTYQRFVVGLLAACLFMVIGVTIADLFGDTIPPCYIRNSEERKEAYELEHVLRQAPDPLTDPKQPRYKQLTGYGSGKPSFPRLNAAGWVGGLLNLVFGSYVAAYFWYIVVLYVRHRFGANDNEYMELIIVQFICIGLWFPLRMLATFYEKYLLTTSWLAAHPPVVILFLIYCMAGWMLFVLAQGRRPLPQWIAWVVLGLTPVIGILANVLPKTAGEIALALQNANPFWFLVLAFVFFVALLLTAFHAYVPPAEGEE
jgi:hypothetical protein